MTARIPRLLALLALALLPVTAVSCHLPSAPRLRAVAREDDPDAAAAYAAMKRGLTSGVNPHPLYDAARSQITRMPHLSVNGDRIDGRLRANAAENSAATSVQTSRETSPESLRTSLGTWTSLGPGNIGGRTLALLIDPRNPNTMYAAAVSGGVFRTIDGGLHWVATSDLMSNIAVSSLAFDPTDSRVLYAGTGEGYFREVVRGTALVIRGNGIFVSRDGAESWTQLPSTTGDDFAFVNHLAVSSHDPRRIYAATRTGVWRSADGGASWSNVLATTVQGGCLDLAFRGDTAGDFLFASCGIFETATVYRNKNAESDAAWESVLSEPDMGRTSLAIAPSNASTIYALAASDAVGFFNQGLYAVFRSDHDGDPGSWSARVRNSDPDRISPLILTNIPSGSTRNCFALGGFAPSNMGWHSNVITVDPKNPERVLAAGVDLYRSDDGGHIWRRMSFWWPDPSTPSFVHADLHAIVFDPRYDGASNRTLFVTTDGGVYRTNNASDAIGGSGVDSGACDPRSSMIFFQSLNHGFTATQFYSGAATPDGRTWFGGAQDNGTPLGTTASGSDGWQSIYRGDGGYVAVDPNAPQTVYAESQYANMGRSQDGGFTWKSAAVAGTADDFLFIAPFIVDHSSLSRLWTGGRRLWRSKDHGVSWEAASATGQFPGQVSALALAPGNVDHLVAGTSSGAIVRNDAATTAGAQSSWSMTTPRDGFVSSLTFTDANTLYATYALFGGGPHLWRSTDGGTTWTATGDDLPDMPLHSLAAYGDRLFLGTDLGVFVSFDNGTTWAVDTTFPAVITESVFLGQGSFGPALYAFTHGRGAWRVELTAPARRRVVGK